MVSEALKKLRQMAYERASRLPPMEPAGTRLIRSSDRREFEIVQAKRITEFGHPSIHYVLKAKGGGQFSAADLRYFERKKR